MKARILAFQNEKLVKSKSVKSHQILRLEFPLFRTHNLPQQKKEKLVKLKCVNSTQLISYQILIFNKKMSDSDLETQDKTEEAESPSFLPFGIINGTSFMVTLACLGLTIFAQAEGNSDLNIFLWMTSACALTLCLLEVSFYMVGFLAIWRKSYAVLLACSSFVATCGIILYFIIGLGYAFCVVMTVFVMEDHPKKVKICLLVNLGLGAARFIILVCSIAVGFKTGTPDTARKITGFLNSLL